jgi:hypothetical protein
MHFQAGRDKLRYSTSDGWLIPPLASELFPANCQTVAA